MVVKKFLKGQKYQLTEDFEDYIYGKISKDTIVTFMGPNLGLAKFRLPDGNQIGMVPKKAFKIIQNAPLPQ